LSVAFVWLFVLAGLAPAIDVLERNRFNLSTIVARGIGWSMIFSENRFPLFVIMP
jgi:hypothetical protein